MDTSKRYVRKMKEAGLVMVRDAATRHLMKQLEMLRDVDLAKQKYGEAISLAKAAGFDEGVAQSTERLRKLTNAR